MPCLKHPIGSLSLRRAIATSARQLVARGLAGPCRTEQAPQRGKTFPNGSVSSARPSSRALHCGPATPAYSITRELCAAVKREARGGSGSLIALRTVMTNSVCECVPVFWKTDLRELRAVSYLILSAFAQDRSDSPVIRRSRRRASAGVKLNRSLRNAI